MEGDEVMRAVVIGPGRVGCGFAGHLLHRSGFDVSFIGHEGTAAKLRQAGHYVVRLTDGRSERDDKVCLQGAVGLEDKLRAARLLAAADVVGVSVGTAAYGDIVEALAAGLSQAPRPVTVVAFENDEHASRLLRTAVGRLAGTAVVDRHSFTGAVVDRAIAHRIFPDRAGEPMLLVAEPVDSFVIDGTVLRGPVPEIEGMAVTGDFAAAYRRKLFRYSAGHAAVAYLGKLKGYRNMHAAVLDAEIAATARAAMREGQAGLAAAYGEELAGPEAEVDAILARFANAALADTVARVGRDPRRKLRAEDRLIGPALLAARAGVVPRALATAAAAALCFSDGAQPSLTGHLGGGASRPAGDTVAELLSDISGLPATDDLSVQIRRAWVRLAGGQGGNLLLSLRRATWAWSPEVFTAVVPALP
jgi:mannitol-1-phosphate 5-dehydrogenase